MTRYYSTMDVRPKDSWMDSAADRLEAKIGRLREQYNRIDDIARHQSGDDLFALRERLNSIARRISEITSQVYQLRNRTKN